MGTGPEIAICCASGLSSSPSPLANPDLLAGQGEDRDAGFVIGLSDGVGSPLELSESLHGVGHVGNHFMMGLPEGREGHEGCLLFIGSLCPGRLKSRVNLRAGS